MDTTDWSKLSHAYGAADDIPGHIEDLQSGDPQRIDNAIGSFWDKIIHQGSVYSASAPSVPYIGQSLPDLPPEQQEAALDLLAALAQGHGWYDVHQHATHLGEVIMSKLEDAEAKLAEERQIVRDTTLAVFAQWDRIAACLDGPPDVRFAALLALTKLAKCDGADPVGAERPEPFLGLRPDGEQKGAYVERVAAIAHPMTEDADPVVRANGLAALFELGRDHPNLTFERLDDLTGLEHFVALMAAAQSRLQTGKRLTADFAPHIARLADTRADGVQQAYLDANWGWDGSPRGTALFLASLLDDDGIDGIADQLVPLLEANAMQLFEYDTILAMILGRPLPKIPDDPCTLSPGRRKLAKVFMRKPHGPDKHWAFWAPRNGNAGAARARANLPQDRKVWLKWLGLPRWEIGPIKF